MSEYSLAMGACLAVAMLLGHLMLLRHKYRQDRRIRALEERLDVFVETSIGVAQTIERLARDGPAHRSTVASRRWLVAQAQERLGQGQSIAQIAAPLGLSGDEVRLLRAGTERHKASAG